MVGSAVIVAPEQTGEMALNVGTINGLTVIVNVVVVAHWPTLGVKVYVVVVVLLTAGDQVPVIPLVDVVGSVGAAVPKQIGVIALKVGVVGFTTLTFNTWLEAQGNSIELGVKV